MRFNNKKEKTEGLSLYNTLFLIAGIALIAGLTKLNSIYTFSWDKLNLSSVAIILIIANVLLGLAYLLVETQKRKMIEDIENTSTQGFKENGGGRYD